MYSFMYSSNITVLSRNNNQFPHSKIVIFISFRMYKQYKLMQFRCCAGNRLNENIISINVEFCKLLCLLYQPKLSLSVGDPVVTEPFKILMIIIFVLLVPPKCKTCCFFAPFQNICTCAKITTTEMQRQIFVNNSKYQQVTSSITRNYKSIVQKLVNNMKMQ